MGVLKDLVKTHRAISKAQNKLTPDAEGRPFNLLQMIIRYVLLFLYTLNLHATCFLLYKL